MNPQSQLWVAVFALSTLNGLVEAVYSYTKQDVEMVKAINSMKTTWTASLNPPEVYEIIESSLNVSHGLEDDNRFLPTLKYRRKDPIPKFFDASDKWPKCKGVINRIRNQGRCSSCWAVQTAAMLSSRTCIGSSGTKQIHLSAEDIMTCCKHCKYSDHSCDGGNIYGAMKFWTKDGIVSGGEYQSQQGCKPYSAEAFVTRTHIPCAEECTNVKYNKSYLHDKNFGKLKYTIPTLVDQIQNEIMDYGPVVAHMDVYPDFRHYGEGVYYHKIQESDPTPGKHAIVILGWGQIFYPKDNVFPYWLCANSWGSGWGGRGGFFHIKRGEYNCGIEKNIIAGRTSSKLSSTERMISPGSKGNSYKPSSMESVILISILMYIA